MKSIITYLVSVLLLSVPGIMGLFQSINRQKILRIIFVVLIILGMILSLTVYYKKEEEIRKIKRYAHVARLGPLGLETEPGPGLISYDPLYNILKNTYKIKDEEIIYDCDFKFEEAMKRAIEFNPDFPFSYYALAICRKNTGEEDWIDYANKAIDIFKTTTNIGGHTKEHDDALLKLQDLLQ